MKSVTTKRFRKAYDALPDHVRQAAIKTYEVWKNNHRHPSLQFKKIHPTKPIYSVRISLAWRVLGLKQGNTVIWFWIGSHTQYEQLIDA